MSYYKQRMAEIQAEKEREFDRVEKRVGTKPTPKPEPKASEPIKPPVVKTVLSDKPPCVVCGSPSVYLIRGFRVCTKSRCKFMAWSF